MKEPITQSLGRILLDPDLLETYDNKDSLREILIGQQMGPFLVENNISADVYLRFQIMANEFFLRYLKEVETHFKDQNIAYVLLKGAALKAHLCVHSRIMKDIDIWVVNPSHFIRARKILLSLGFQEKVQRRWAGADNRYDFVLETSLEKIEIHIDLHQKLYWNVSKNIYWQIDFKNNQPVLATEDQVFHLIVNWLYQDGGVDLYKIYDLHSVLTSTEHFSWNHLKFLAKSQRLDHTVALALAVLDLVFETSWKNNWKISPSTLKLAQRLVHSDFFIAPKKQILLYVYFKHWVRSTWFQALSYDFLWLNAYWKPFLNSLVLFLLRRPAHSTLKSYELPETHPEKKS